MDETKKPLTTSGKYVGAFIPQAHHDTLRRAAAALDRSMSSVLRELIKHYAEKTDTAIKELREM